MKCKVPILGTQYKLDSINIFIFEPKAINNKQDMAYHCETPQTQQSLIETNYTPHIHLMPPNSTISLPLKANPNAPSMCEDIIYKDNLLSKGMTLSRLYMLKGGL